MTTVYYVFELLIPLCPLIYFMELQAKPVQKQKTLKI